MRLPLASDPLLCHCRIGKIRAKNGAVLHVLPGLAERNAKEAWAALEVSMSQAGDGEYYRTDLDGFILIAWNGELDWSCWHRVGRSQHPNTLAEFARGSVERQLGYERARKLFEDTLQNK